MPKARGFATPIFIIKIVLIALIYFASAKIGLQAAFTIKQVSLVWPPTGVALAALILFGREYWPGILIGAFLANLTTDEFYLVAFGISIGNTLEALAGSYLLGKFNFDKKISKASDIVKIIILSGFVSSLISASIGTLSLFLYGTLNKSNFLSTWLMWYMGDAIGSVIFTPLILSWANIKAIRLSFWHIVEGVILTISTTLVSILVFTSYITSKLSMYPIKYAVFPFIVWAAMNFGLKGATAITLLISVISIIGFEAGGGPFASLGLPELGLLLLQILMAIFASTAMVLAALSDERKKSQEMIGHSEKRFRHLIENSNDAIVLINKYGIITYASPSCYVVLGYTPEELTGKGALDVVYKDDIERLNGILGNLIKNPGQTVKATYRIAHKNGTIRWAEGTGTNLLNDPDVGAIVGNFRDITEHKRIDEIKTEFVSLAAHELRAPLGNIRWYAESLVKDGKKSKNLTNYINEIYSSALKMISLVNLLLNVSKAELGTLVAKPEKIDIVAETKDAVQDYLPEIHKKGIKLTQNYSKLTILAFIDPTLLKMVLDNLISNAVKYTPDLGRVNVSVSVKSGNVYFEFKDNGLGIPESQKDKIFTKLFRADNVKKRFPSGSGLGLYLVKAIVDKMDGQIKFESQENKGTAFLVVLPLKEKA